MNDTSSRLAVLGTIALTLAGAQARTLHPAPERHVQGLVLVRSSGEPDKPIFLMGNFIHDHLNQGTLGHGHHVRIEENVIADNGFEPDNDPSNLLFGPGRTAIGGEPRHDTLSENRRETTHHGEEWESATERTAERLVWEGCAKLGVTDPFRRAQESCGCAGYRFVAKGRSEPVEPRLASASDFINLRGT